MNAEGNVAPTQKLIPSDRISSSMKSGLCSFSVWGGQLDDSGRLCRESYGSGA